MPVSAELKSFVKIRTYMRKIPSAAHPRHRHNDECCRKPDRYQCRYLLNTESHYDNHKRHL